MKRSMSVAALVLLVVSSARAQTAQERTFPITLPQSHLEYIGRVLDKQPYGEVAHIVGSIQQQISAHLTREANAAREAERERLKSELSKQQPQTEEPKP